MIKPQSKVILTVPSPEKNLTGGYAERPRNLESNSVRTLKPPTPSSTRYTNNPLSSLERRGLLVYLVDDGVGGFKVLTEFDSKLRGLSAYPPVRFFSGDGTVSITLD